MVPIRLAVVRLRAHAQRNLLAAIGIAVGAGVLAMTAVGAVAVQDRAAQRALAGLQPSDRAVQALWSGVPAQSNLSYPQLDRLVGRFEPRIDAAEGVVQVLAVWWEDGFVPRREKEFVDAMRDALGAYLRFAKASRLEWPSNLSAERRLFGATASG